jgi:glycine cleavage system H protein
MATLRFAKTHEYIAEDGGVFTVGISEFAASELGDITVVELPEPGAAFSQGDRFATVESVKAVSDVYAPVDLEVLEANAALTDSPETVNSDAHGAGWFAKVKPTNPAQLDGLISETDYSAMDKEAH